jgi:flavin-dependent dehydrogenase
MHPDTLTNPRRIAIIGGGPAGAFSALLLLGRALAQGRELEVLVFDRKEFGVTGPRGCNMCAGIVSNSLIERLDALGVPIPEAVIQRPIESYAIHAENTRLRLQRPPGTRIYAAFRSGGPMGEEFGAARSFDHLLRQAAVGAGAVHLPRVVREVKLPQNRHEPVVLRDGEGDEHAFDAVIGAFGVNSRMVQHFEQLGFGYRGPGTAMACQGEIPLTSAEIDACFGNEVKVLAVNIPGVRLAVMVPKQRHVTASLIGPQVGEAHLRRFLQLPLVRALLQPGWEPPDTFCHCHPLLPVSVARHPVTDRLLVVGDAHTSRYLKNGLDSAFVTASLAADAILSGGVSAEHLSRSYARQCRRIFEWDNRCGRIMFGVHALLGKTPRLAAAHLRLAQREQQGDGRKPLSRVLWGMLTGDERYCTILRLSLDPGLQARLGWESLKALFSPVRQAAGAPSERGAPEMSDH